MKTKGLSLTSVLRLFVPALLILTGCSQTVWVKAGATEADSQVAVERCLSAAYLQAPSAPAVATIGSDVVSPSFTTCSGLGFSGSCVTSRGQYTRPLTVRYDANARMRTQVFRQCMYAAGWSEQTRSSSAMAEAPETDWTKGFDVGLTQGAGAQCVNPPNGIANSGDWSLGCQSGEQAR
ncbi:MAG TPA: hypothetical protein VKI44_01745 [Acetobacteraceae bacterium]|nr:hypothetical protein [Acetobacteraceae bacterium]